MKEKKELWDLFTKREEYNPHILDKYSRFPHYLSNNRNVFEPKVSKYLVENGFKPEYPDGKKFAVCLTHDIDAIKQRYLSYALNSVKSCIKGDIKGAIKYPTYAIDKKKHPYWNFRETIKLEEKYGATSSFYFLALDPGERDYNYDLQYIKDEIRFIDARGWEVGLHGGHRSYNNYEDLLKKKNKLESFLGKKVIGYRNHFLRFKTPETWELLSKAGLKYDATFGYNDCAGFRNGMCHPFRPINLKTGKEIDIVEIPLTIMDCTLLRDYMRLDFKSSWNLTKQLIDTVAKYNGVITILWHNTYMLDEYLEFYEKILKYCYEKDAWMTSGKEICEWTNKL
ncbi:polysaccharide deacetylase family protein [Methanococcoides orientis]|uniref:polysaccharide deacetylase family protein n=1 Tax=Methanococcoides orientis TaxID=2822137 RepID=UPI0028730794|nr:polysaccharide deacetylase family protein [Methanococcoides orientis]